LETIRELHYLCNEYVLNRTVWNYKDLPREITHKSYCGYFVIYEINGADIYAAIESDAISDEYYAEMSKKDYSTLARRKVPKYLLNKFPDKSMLIYNSFSYLEILEIWPSGGTLSPHNVAKLTKQEISKLSETHNILPVLKFASADPIREFAEKIFEYSHKN
jgi:hypothetical protein